jgi:hypothetical protein
MTAAATTPATTTTTTLLNWDACRQLHLQKTMTPDKTVTTVLCDVLFNCGPQPLA